MDIQMLTKFFMWCTIINGALLLLATLLSMVAPGLIYRIQTKCYPMPQERFTEIFYSLLGLYKIVFFVFNLIPLIALLIVG